MYSFLALRSFFKNKVLTVKIKIPIKNLKSGALVIQIKKLTNKNKKYFKSIEFFDLKKINLIIKIVRKKIRKLTDVERLYSLSLIQKLNQAIILSPGL